MNFNDDVKDIKIGNTSVKEVRIGTTKIWPKDASAVSLKDTCLEIIPKTNGEVRIFIPKLKYQVSYVIEDEGELRYILEKYTSPFWLYYSTDLIHFLLVNNLTSDIDLTISLNAGQILSLRGDGRVTSGTYVEKETNIIRENELIHPYINCSVLFDVQGILHALYDDTDKSVSLIGLFKNSNVCDASQLIIKGNTNRYQNGNIIYHKLYLSTLFENCTSLTKSPYFYTDNLRHHGSNYKVIGFQGIHRIFKGCTNLQEISDSIKYAIVIDSAHSYYELFKNCSSLKTAYLPEEIQFYEAAVRSYYYTDCYGTFENCTSLESAIVPHIGKNMFKGCSKLKNLYIDKDFNNYNISRTDSDYGYTYYYDFLNGANASGATLTVNKNFPVISNKNNWIKWYSEGEYDIVMLDYDMNEYDFLYSSRRDAFAALYCMPINNPHYIPSNWTIKYKDIEFSTYTSIPEISFSL